MKDLFAQLRGGGKLLPVLRAVDLRTVPAASAATGHEHAGCQATKKRSSGSRANREAAIFAYRQSQDTRFSSATNVIISHIFHDASCNAQDDLLGLLQ